LYHFENPGEKLRGTSLEFEYLAGWRGRGGEVDPQATFWVPSTVVLAPGSQCVCSAPGEDTTTMTGSMVLLATIFANLLRFANNDGGDSGLESLKRNLLVKSGENLVEDANEIALSESVSLLSMSSCSSNTLERPLSMALQFIHIQRKVSVAYLWSESFH
jgi:hypothetical protein